MVNKLELSLDDIIKINKKKNQKRGGGSKNISSPRRGGGGRGRGRGASRGGGRASTNGNANTPVRGQSASRGRGRGRGKASARGGGQANTSFRGTPRSRGAARGGRGDSARRGAKNTPRKKSVIGGGVQQRKPITPRGRGGKRLSMQSSKLMINNLDFNVTDGDMNELFSKFGQLKRAVVHYDSTGKSLGTAEVIFQNQKNAIKAMNQYNNVPLDGRPMKIVLVDFLNQSVPIDSRLGAKVNDAPSPRGATPAKRGRGRGSARGGRGGAARGGRGGSAKAQGAATRNGRGRGRGRGGKGRQAQKPVSAEELDKQLDEYIQHADN